VMSKLLRPFNEVTARLISLGHYAATQARPFPAWTKSAERFGVQPRTMEQYLAESWPRLMARPS